tara:strand:+ start:334 stop:594 length:261 start_codon:yes stop_codon:yes gene_type:complete
MKKEIKYFFYVVTIFSFLIFVGSYYFSDKNIKNSYRANKSFENKVIKYDFNLNLLESDTVNIIEYPENNEKINKKKYKFWELLDND